MSNIDRAAEVIHDTVQEWPQDDVAGVAARRLAEAGLLMPDIPDGLNLIGFEREGRGGGLLWDDHITTEALTKGYTAMFARILEGGTQ